MICNRAPRLSRWVLTWPPTSQPGSWDVGESVARVFLGNNLGNSPRQSCLGAENVQYSEGFVYLEPDQLLCGNPVPGGFEMHTVSRLDGPQQAGVQLWHAHSRTKTLNASTIMQSTTFPGVHGMEVCTRMTRCMHTHTRALHSLEPRLSSSAGFGIDPCSEQ